MEISHWSNLSPELIAIRKRYVKQIIPPKESSAQKKARISKNLKIISGRGTKIHGWRTCDTCGAYTDINWKYKETTQGEITICPVCKDKYRPRRLPYKTIIKTATESNGRKH